MREARRIFAIVLHALLHIQPLLGFMLANSGIDVTNKISTPNWPADALRDRIVNQKRLKLPDRLIVGYANWNECDEHIIDAVKNGVNVVMWFAINLAVDADTGQPTITNGPDMDCVADIVSKISKLGLETVHIISIGGWNSPHPDTTNSAEDTYEHWNYWNRFIAARPEKGFYGFDGFDWDIEGNDDPESPYNHFTVECLDLMGRFSQLAKERGGYVVSMAPAESYLDPTKGSFDRSLRHEYDEWKDKAPGFAYHGLNTYAYLLARYGRYGDTISSTEFSSSVAVQGEDDISLLTVKATQDDQLNERGTVLTLGQQLRQEQSETKRERSSQNYTFDFITIQLYEGYSHAEYNISVLKEPAVDYLSQFVKSVEQGWDVDFSSDSELNFKVIYRMAIDSSRLVIGLANGWAGDGKFLLIFPDQVGRSYTALRDLHDGSEPRGFAFWNILDEGAKSPQRPLQPVWMAAGLNRFMKTRAQVRNDNSKKI